MKISSLETLRLGEFPNLVWVRLHTDEGLVGLGETFMGAAAVEAYLHESVAPKLLGRDARHIEAIGRDLTNYLGWRSAGVETRGNSAVDIALWDRLSKDEQSALQACAVEGRDEQRKVSRALSEKSLANLKARGMQVNDIDPKERQRMFEKAKTVYEKHQGTIGADTVKRMLDNLAQIRR